MSVSWQACVKEALKQMAIQEIKEMERSIRLFKVLRERGLFARSKQRTKAETLRKMHH